MPRGIIFLIIKNKIKDKLFLNVDGGVCQKIDAKNDCALFYISI